MTFKKHWEVKLFWGLYVAVWAFLIWLATT